MSKKKMSIEEGELKQRRNKKDGGEPRSRKERAASADAGKGKPGDKHGADKNPVKKKAKASKKSKKSKK